MKKLSIPEVSIFVDGKVEGYSLALRHKKFYGISLLIIGILIGLLIGSYIGMNRGVNVYRDWRWCVDIFDKSYCDANYDWHLYKRVGDL